MYKVTLEIASNGVIKTIVDDNANGGGEFLEEKKVYHLENDGESDFENTIEFIADICDDLGIDRGSKHTRKRLNLDADYGDNYTLTDAELKAEIDMHAFELKYLRQELKDRKAHQNKQ